MFISLDLSRPYLSTELSEIDTLPVLKNMIKLSVFQDSHGDYNVGPIMLFC